MAAARNRARWPGRHQPGGGLLSAVAGTGRPVPVDPGDPAGHRHRAYWSIDCVAGPFTRGSGVLAVYTLIVIVIGVPAYALDPERRQPGCLVQRNTARPAAELATLRPEHAATRGSGLRAGRPRQRDSGGPGAATASGPGAGHRGQRHGGAHADQLLQCLRAGLLLAGRARVDQAGHPAHGARASCADP